jgi:hypothetical protein
MRKAKLILLLANLALVAAWLGQFHKSTWTDGH